MPDLEEQQMLFRHGADYQRSRTLRYGGHDDGVDHLMETDRLIFPLLCSIKSFKMEPSYQLLDNSS
jgi:hypothetical protein